MSARRSSIERKFLVATLAVAIAGIAIVSAVLLFSGWRNMQRDRLAHAEVLVDMIASNCAPAIVFSDENVARQILAGAAVEPSTIVAAVYTADGSVFAQFPASEPAVTLPRRGTERFRYADRSLDVFADITMNGKRVGSAFVRLDLAPMRARLRLYIGTTLLCMVIATAGAFALARYLQGRIVNPLLDLYRTATAIAERRDFSLRATKTSTDEIGDLVDAFNAMVEDIEASHATISGHAADLEREVQERTAKLRELVSELETFSYTVSHDLRAPLRAIIGFGEAALDPETTPEERTDFTTRSMRAARRMDRLVTDLLRYARLSKSEIALGPVELDRVVHDVLTEYFDLGKTAAEIVVRRPLGVVIGDDAALVQVISNLVGNALKFVPEGRRPKVEIWTQERGRRTRVSVRDNGIGIPEEQRDRLFRIFERLHVDTRFEGTGIGLSIVKKAVEKMDGAVGVDSEPGCGSTFWFELPTAEARSIPPNPNPNLS